MTYRKAPSFPIFLKLNESLFFPLQVAKFQSFIIAYSGKCYIEGPLTFFPKHLRWLIISYLRTLAVDKHLSTLMYSPISRLILTYPFAHYVC